MKKQQRQKQMMNGAQKGSREGATEEHPTKCDYVALELAFESSPTKALALFLPPQLPVHRDLRARELFEGELPQQIMG